eukprot:CAMPEP_0115457808 /NCGR_PEP_ID=MMETSP0271-20121206/45409_1 /TAXON_ID=71861 /ORGANISM="Scrippsiella trochoidea, Strain CCMP3099" /LENGTH=49 /DNA_ID= /DNA_START= /DNA_END= /DNA_ORIENTATION=
MCDIAGEASIVDDHKQKAPLRRATSAAIQHRTHAHWMLKNKVFFSWLPS